ncbi:rna-directed dna polymerase from mobile element jockey-like [Limosa lapponica baueri]|uniref:Rna-directed dna polymerase from mobile element jockey-like n=1 Tax=Limosa lapponica baueri TaxID=1758121 RepID=A0A2I0UIJ0_LIMLA|nr:rna-directed dna polymerase from mobile element jockey-like [Limosa lapponica baueri]
MGNKQEELEAIVQQENYNIVAITETWWDDLHNWSAAINGYQLFRRGRQGRRGGGVALYVRDRFECLEVNNGNDSVQCLWVRLKGKANKADIMVGVYYRPPNQDVEVDETFYQQLEQLLQSLALVLVGDFNFPDICWKYNTAEREQSRRFLECVEDNFLTQLVSEPTRESALLDLLLVNREGFVGDVKVQGRLGQSDHEIIEFSILAEARHGASRTATLDFRKEDFGLLRSMVESVPWETVLKGKGAQEGWSYFKEELSKAQEKAIPRSHKTSRRGRRPVWLNRGFWLDLREKRKVYDLWKKGLVTYEQYQGVVKIRGGKIRRAKAQADLNLATTVKDNKKSVFQYINKKRKTRENVGPLMNEVGALVVEHTEKAELLNAFFALVFTAKAAPHEFQTLETRGKVWREEDFSSIGEDWVRDHLAKLDIHKSMGPDGMHPRVLRELADVIAEPLSIIYERSRRTGEVPEVWRKANITPVYKKGRREDPGNYRPISLTSVPGKIMERLVLDVISKHIEDKEVIGSGQHGLTKVLDAQYDKEVETVEQGPGRISELAGGWNTCPGSVLGPLLFNIFVGNMDSGIGCTLSKFANNTKLCGVVDMLKGRDAIQRDLGRLERWDHENLMKFNKAKYKVLHMGHGNPKHVHRLGGEQIQGSPEEKDLGVLVDEKLNMSQQCALAAQKANWQPRKPTGLHQKRHSRLRNVIVSLYSTPVRPHLEYRIQLWDP